MNVREVYPPENECGCPPEPSKTSNVNWTVIVIVLVFGMIIMSREIHFEFDVKPTSNTEKGTTTSNNELNNNVQPVNFTEEEKLPEELSVPLSSKKVPYIVYVLDLNYASRKNIDPKVVNDAKKVINGYVDRYSNVAVTEMKKYGVPASITLAQGLLESDAGSSRLAKQNNNHFGVKCFSKNCKKGHCANYTDDSHKDFFRKYGSVWESFRDHSLFLQKGRYKHLLSLDKTDYKSWAMGLSKAGYATDKRYANKLIQIIEVLKLHEYDKM